MIPVTWYIWLMLGAGVLTLLYGIGTADAKTIMGSFLFLGLGGFAFFMHRKQNAPVVVRPRADATDSLDTDLAKSTTTLDPESTRVSQRAVTHLEPADTVPPRPNRSVPTVSGERTMVCNVCGKESADNFKFCPHCGKAFDSSPSMVELPDPPLKAELANDSPKSQLTLNEKGGAGSGIQAGTIIFGAFSAISLLVSIVRGVVPIFLLEAAGWAGAAWYWQSKKTHSETAKGIVIALAALVAVGEVIHIATSVDSRTTAAPGPSYTPDYTYANTPSGSQTAAPAGSEPAPTDANIEQEAAALFKQRRYAEARPLFEQACTGGEMTACSYLGYLYGQGLGGVRDTKRAHDVYKRACDDDVLSSCASLGSLYQDAGDTESARKYFQKACTGGVAEACGLLREEH